MEAMNECTGLGKITGIVFVSKRQSKKFIAMLNAPKPIEIIEWDCKGFLGYKK